MVFKKVRSIGSAAIMLAQVAEGICDVYFEEIYLWDVATGLSLVKRAGSIFGFIEEDGNTMSLLQEQAFI